MANLRKLGKKNGKFEEFKPKFAIICQKINYFKPESTQICVN